jgi:Flp pilus assembly protein TadD
LASRAVELVPTNAAFRNTLGVAHYRAGEFELAKRALEKSLELQEDDAFVLFFLAMTDWQLGNEDAARQRYREAVESMEQHRPEDKVLIRFHREVTELLGMPTS